jgi:hypothetical protein
MREATVGDIPLLAGHRAAMFRDMGRLASDREAALVRATADYFRNALPRGEYLGWVAQSNVSPAEPIDATRAILPHAWRVSCFRQDETICWTDAEDRSP